MEPVPSSRVTRTSTSVIVACRPANAIRRPVSPRSPASIVRRSRSESLDETAPGRYALLWRTPVLSGMRLPVRLEFPDGVHDVREPTVQEPISRNCSSGSRSQRPTPPLNAVRPPAG